MTVSGGVFAIRPVLKQASRCSEIFASRKSNSGIENVDNERDDRCLMRSHI